MTLHFRWALWFFGITCCIAFLLRSQGKVGFGKRLVDRHHSRLLLGACSIFLILALLEKYSQFYSFRLNANDFWLFVDILEQTQKGGPFLTRFAPQSLGFVQHGSVHPMFTWGLLTPLAFVFGSVHVALCFGPVILTGAGLVLACLTKKRWGKAGSFLIMLSFFASTQVAKVLFYEVHPEAGYPFFVFLWFWSLGWDGSHQVRWKTLTLSILLGMGIKEDSFLVFVPWIVWGFVSNNGKQRKALALSAVITVGVMIIQLKAVNLWVNQVLGPIHWEGFPVIINASVGAFKGAHWDGISGIWDLLQALIQGANGLNGILKKICLFWISRPWLSLLVFAPWVVRRSQFWFVLFPLTAVYAILDGPNILWNYYSAPFLASFWFCAALGPDFKIPKPSKQMTLWMVISTCFLGGNSIQIELPTKQVHYLRKEVKALVPCLGQKGVVAPQFIGLVPQEKIWTERMPRNQAQWKIPDFILVSPKVDRYELSSKNVEELLNYAESNPNWKQVGPGCLPIQPARRDLSVVLFVKSSGKADSI